MARPGPFDRDRAVKILVDALAVGDEQAAARWGVCTKTLQRYRARLANDPELARAVKATSQKLDAEWRTARRTFLRAGIRKLQELVDLAGVDKIREVAGAIKIVGDLEITSGVLDEPEHNDDERRDAEHEPKPSTVLQ